MSIQSRDIATRPITAADTDQLSALQRLVFGPGRFARTAYRVREACAPISPFDRLAVSGSTLVASIRLTPIRIGGRDGAVLLGPLAVHPDHANLGYGRRLIHESLSAAQGQDRSLALLVGNMSYYGRLGFNPVEDGRIRFPGPVDPARILALELAAGTLASFSGLVAGA